MKTTQCACLKITRKMGLTMELVYLFVSTLFDKWHALIIPLNERFNAWLAKNLVVIRNHWSITCGTVNQGENILIDQGRRFQCLFVSNWEKNISDVSNVKMCPVSLTMLLSSHPCLSLTGINIHWTRTAWWPSWKLKFAVDLVNFNTILPPLESVPPALCLV